MNRRKFLSNVGSAAAFSAIPPCPTAELRQIKSTSDQPPRKVVVGTMVQRFWVEYPGLESRLHELSVIVDEMCAQSRQKYGRDVDLAILPESVVTGEVGEHALENSVPLEGRMQEVFAAKARQHRCYLIAPTFLLESAEKKLCSNAAILFGRDGEVMGLYRKAHLVASTSGLMEGGCTPGKEFPVFDCDFGKLGIQICYDIEFDLGWDELARKGAEIIAWPSQSPQTFQPPGRAIRHRCYIVSSTWRDNASVFEPTGKIVAQVRPPERVLAYEFDLSYAILPWSRTLQQGELLSKAYGDRIGFHYYNEEDRGIFWSNDKTTTVAQMVRGAGLLEMEQNLKRQREIYSRASVPGY
jgi:predicted amidohydrolase